MRYLLGAFMALFLCPAFADDWYVRPSEGTYGTSDGSSYANAFDGASDIVWGVGGVQAGDTLWYCGTWNNTEGHGPGGAGTAGNPITIRGDGFEQGKCGNETSRASIRRTSAGVFAFTIGGGDNYVTVKGFRFTGSSQGTADYNALLRIEMTGGTITDVIVEDNIFDGSTDDVLGILISPENRTNDVTNLTIRNNTFQNFNVAANMRDAIRIVPKTLDGSQNGSTTCVANVGHPVNLTISGNTFDTAKQAVRMQNLEGTSTDYNDCMAGRAEGFIFENNTVRNMRETAINFDCKSGFLCTVRNNYFGVVGFGNYDLANAVQTGKADGAIIEGNTVMGSVNDGSAGDGVGIIVDHAGIYRFVDHGAWTAATAYSLGTFRRPTTANDFRYEVTSVSGTGTSGAVEPTWPTTAGATVTDNPGANQIVWTARERISLQSDGVIVRRNFVTNNKSNSEACGISIWSADNTVVHSNVITDSTNGICMTGDGTSGTASTDNSGTRIYNNTIADSVDEGLEIARTAIAFEFYNNLIIGGRWAVNIETGSTAPTDGTNAYSGWATAQVGGTGSYTPASSTITASPRTIGTNDLQSGDFRLRDDSPLRRAGTYVGPYHDFGNRLFSTPPTIGAWEVASGDQANRTNAASRTNAANRATANSRTAR